MPVGGPSEWQTSMMHTVKVSLVANINFNYFNYEQLKAVNITLHIAALDTLYAP